MVTITFPDREAEKRALAFLFPPFFQTNLGIA